MSTVIRRSPITQLISSGPAIVAQPTSPNRLVEIFTNAKQYPSPIRPIGSGSTVTRGNLAPGGTLIEFGKMDRVLDIDGKTVTVQPGILLSELAETLREEGLELLGGFDLSNHTVGGALCSPILGAPIGADVGQFAGQVTQIKAITPQGKKLAATAKTQSLLTLMRHSYGLLGAVYEISLKVRPIQEFSVSTAKVSFGDFASLGPKLSTTAAGLKLYLYPFRDHIYFELRQSAHAKNEGKKRAWRLKDWGMYWALPSVAKTLRRVVPADRLRYALADRIGAVTQSMFNGSLARNGSNATEQSGRFASLAAKKYDYCTWAFPAVAFSQAAIAYQEFTIEHYARSGFRCDLPAISFRMGQDRSAVLSPSYGGALFTLTPLSTPSDGWDEFCFNFAEFAMGYGGVPLLNQTRSVTPEHISKCFGNRLAFFRKMRSQFDPDNRMLNQYFEAYIEGA